MTKLLYVSTRRITLRDMKYLSQLSDILSQYEEFSSDSHHEKGLLEELTLESDGDIDESSIALALKGRHEAYDWVHIEMNDSNWKALGIKDSLWGQSREVNGTIFTYGRWSDFSPRTMASLVSHEYPDLYEHVNGMIHEYLHAKEGNQALVHSFMYGYDRVYSKAEERAYKPKRYQKMSSLKKLLECIYNKKKVPHTEPIVEKVASEMYKPTNFSIQELVSPKLLSRLGEDVCWQMFDERALRNLQWLRERFGTTYVNINGSFKYRGFDGGELRKLGTSQHNHGRAFDMHFKDYTIAEVHAILREEYMDMPEPNCWIEGTHKGNPISWLHFDVRASDKVGIYFFNA